jgi:plastocyanin
MSVRFVAALVLVAVCNMSCSRGSSASVAPASAAANSEKASTAGSDKPSAKTNQVVGSVPGNAGANGPVVVMLSSVDQHEWPPQSEKPVMDQISQTFTPPLLFVRTGAPVEFRNSDGELHNINVKDENTRAQAFNVAIPTGEIFTYTFDHDGFYHVACDIHPAMAAEIVSASTPFLTTAGDEGRFLFDDVPAGSYLVTAFAGGTKLSQDVKVGSGVTEVRLVENSKQDAKQ